MKSMPAALVFLLLIRLSLNPTIASVPNLINYQGLLEDNDGNLLDGYFDLTFTLYPNSEGTDPLWSEEHLDTYVKDGLFQVILGNITPLSEAIFEGDTVWIGIQVGTTPEMRPLLQLTAVPWALRAAVAETVVSPPQVGCKDLVFPDGIDGFTAVLDEVWQGVSYTVPTGKNLYITYLNQTESFQIDGIQLFDIPWLENAYLEMPLIAGEGQVLTSDGTPFYASTIFSGFLVDASVTPVTIDLMAGLYMVPADKVLVITNLYSNDPSSSLIYDGDPTIYSGICNKDGVKLGQPLIVGPGRTLNAYGSSMAFNGYLK